MLAGQISGAEQIAQRLRGLILGDQLLDFQIDRRRLDASPYWAAETTPSGNAPWSRRGSFRSGKSRPDVR